MSAQNVQLIALVSQDDETASVPDVQQLLEDQLIQKYEYLRQRFQAAFMYTAMATGGVIVALIVISALNISGISQMPDDYRLYETFYEWRSEGATQYPICSWDCEIVTQSTRLLTAASDIALSVISSSGQGNIAGMARLCTVVAVLFTVGFSFRRHLLLHYTINAQPAQREDFETMPPWQRWLNRLLYVLAAVFGTYVAVSVLWLGLSLVFREVNLNWFRAGIVIVLFTGTITFIATYLALAASTRDILLLGLFILGVGFSVSFALVPQSLVEHQWWQVAVSNAGQFNPSASLFTGTLLSGSLALAIPWFDTDSIIHKMIDDGDVRLLSADGWRWVARLLYFVLVLGLLLIAFIRVDQVNYPFNMVFHAGGSIAAIVSAIIAGLLIRKKRFHRWYRIFTVYILLGLTLGMSILGSLKLDPLSIVYPGTGIISLVVIELALFVLIGLWLYITAENLLGQANINAFDGQVIVMIRREKVSQAQPESDALPLPESRAS